MQQRCSHPTCMVEFRRGGLRLISGSGEHNCRYCARSYCDKHSSKRHNGKRWCDICYMLRDSVYVQVDLKGSRGSDSLMMELGVELGYGESKPRLLCRLCLDTQPIQVKLGVKLREEFVDENFSALQLDSSFACPLGHRTDRLVRLAPPREDCVEVSVRDAASSPCEHSLAHIKIPLVLTSASSSSRASSGRLSSTGSMSYYTSLDDRLQPVVSRQQQNN